MSDHTRAMLSRWMRYAALAGGAGFLVCLLGLFFARPASFRAYWFAWVFWSGVALGSLPLLLLQFVTGGAWTRFAQRPAEAGAATIPFMGVLLLPALFGLPHVFPWMHAELWRDQHWPHKEAWLTPVWFIVRTVLYFAILTALAVFARRRTHDRTMGSAKPLGALGAGGLIAYVLCMNFAAVDWVMSLEPQWTSTIFVYVFVIGQFHTALAVAVVLMMSLAADPALCGVTEPALMRDYGNLLLAFVMFWAYVSFSQFLIIWSGNLPREISWYLHRRDGGWGGFVVVLAIVQFFLPFLLLLSRAVKQHRGTLRPLAALIFVANALAVYWQIAPSFSPTALRFHLLDLAAFIGLGGVWVALYLRALLAQPLVPAHFGKEPVHA